MAPPFLLLLQQRWSSTSPSIGPSPLPPSSSPDPTTIAVLSLASSSSPSARSGLPPPARSPMTVTLASDQISHLWLVPCHRRPGLQISPPSPSPSSASNSSLSARLMLLTPRPNLQRRLISTSVVLFLAPTVSRPPGLSSLPGSALLDSLFTRFCTHVGILSHPFLALPSSTVSFLGSAPKSASSAISSRLYSPPTASAVSFGEAPSASGRGPAPYRDQRKPGRKSGSKKTQPH